MVEITNDNNTIDKRCGYHGNCYLNNVDSHILHLVMQKIVIKSLLLNFSLSNNLS